MSGAYGEHDVPSVAVVHDMESYVICNLLWLMHMMDLMLMMHMSMQRLEDIAYIVYVIRENKCGAMGALRR